MNVPSWIWHGGGLAAAKAHFGGTNWLDLSTGINPHMWPGHQTIAIDWNRLPEAQEIAALEATAARYFGCDPVHVCAVPGSEIAMRLLGRLLPEPFFHTTASYRSHAALGEGSQPVARIDGPPNPLAGPAGTYILANPNNPDGTRTSRQALLALQADRQAHGRAHTASGWLVVDEAFADCDPVDSLAQDVAETRNLLVLRSFGKFFGMAGLRLGFVLGPTALLDGLRARLGAWPVSAAAVAFGRQAYGDAAWIARMRTDLAAQGAQLDRLLRDYGLSPRGSCPLFRLVECAEAGQLFQHLARHAILTRPFDYALDWLRIGLPKDANGYGRLERALAAYV